MAHLQREVVLLASGARTATQTLGPYFNPDDTGDTCAIEIILDLTAFVTAASLTLSIEEWNPGAAAFRTVLAGVAITAIGVSRIRIGPSYGNTANVSQGDHLGTQYRVVVTHGNANSHTYSVTAQRIYER